MTYPIRIGVQLQPQHADYAQIRDAVARAEDTGVDVVFNWDHFFPLYGEPDGKHFECWTMLGAWADAAHRRRAREHLARVRRRRDDPSQA